MTYESETMNLITIEQLPVVAERFSQMVEPVRMRVDEILAMDCTEETKKAIKAERAALNRFRDEMKAAVRSKKNELFAPWVAVEDEVKRIDRICAEADEALKDKIGAVESEEKSAKERALRGYFDEKCIFHDIEWLEYESMPLTVRLSDSMKSLYRTVDTFVERIAADAEVILRMEDAPEIMYEYKKCLNLASAVKIVAERKINTAAEAESLGIAKEKSEASASRTKEVERACEDAQKSESLKAPVCVCDDKNTLVRDGDNSCKRYNAEFRVTGTLEQLRALKKFIVENGIEIIE
jgi:hypothetical protein